MEAGALHAPAGLSRISIASPLLRLRSDEQLVAAFRAGNEDAFQVIFDRYRQRLFAYTRQMLGGSRQDAEDALQDVFLRAYGALRANDRPLSLRAWLYRVAHNRCIDQLRRPTPAQADVFDLSRSPLRDPLEESQRREDLRRLVEDVQRLPEAQRSALLMREMDGLSYQELADALDVTVPAIKSLLVRARIGLVEAIEARDTSCVEIRNDLMASYDKGVRASGKARRHLRDCSGCRTYRTELRSLQRGLGALAPSHGPMGAFLKLFGLGSGAGGAAAGSGAVLGGGGAATVVGGGAATATACKVAVVVCSAALVTGAAGDIENAVKRAVQPLTAPAHTASISGASANAASRTPVTRGATLSRSPMEKLTAAPVAASAAAGATTAAADRATHVRALREAAKPSAAAAANAPQPITPDDEIYADANAQDAAASATAKPAVANVTGGAVAPSPPTETPTTDPTSTTGATSATGSAPTTSATGSTSASATTTTGTSTGTTSGTSSTSTSTSASGSVSTGPAAAAGTAAPITASTPVGTVAP